MVERNINILISAVKQKKNCIPVYFSLLLHLQVVLLQNKWTSNLRRIKSVYFIISESTKMYLLQQMVRFLFVCHGNWISALMFWHILSILTSVGVVCIHNYVIWKEFLYWKIPLRCGITFPRVSWDKKEWGSNIQPLGYITHTREIIIQLLMGNTRTSLLSKILQNCSIPSIHFIPAVLTQGMKQIVSFSKCMLKRTILSFGGLLKGVLLNLDCVWSKLTAL